MSRDEKGRFTKQKELSPKQLNAIAELIANGGNKEATCKKLKIAKQTLYDWLDMEIFYTEYKKRCEKVFNASLAKAVRRLDIAIDSNDSRTSMKAIENILKLNGYLSTKVDVTENTTENITITLLDDDSKEE